MSSPIWYPESTGCKDCEIACTIVASAQTKYMRPGYIMGVTKGQVRLITSIDVPGGIDAYLEVHNLEMVK